MGFLASELRLVFFLFRKMGGCALKDAGVGGRNLAKSSGPKNMVKLSYTH